MSGFLIEVINDNQYFYFLFVILNFLSLGYGYGDDDQYTDYYSGPANAYPGKTPVFYILKLFSKY